MPFIVGESVGPYKISAQIGQGGMATVYKAHHAALDRFVAIKVMYSDLGQDPNFAARFKREARVVAKLDHPNIVPVHDFAEEDGHPYLVMKYIEGETLKEKMTRSQLPPEEIVRVAEAIGSALGFAHRQGILHRDIKPSNVLIGPDGHVYLADFGLARIAQETSATLTAGAVIGTPHYISPEQAIGSKDLDEGTDIYSFGVMLYEMVVGRPPFVGETPLSIIYNHIHKPFPMPRSINPTIPEAVEWVFIKALAKERSERYASVEEMVAAFKAAWKKEPPPATYVNVRRETAPPQRESQVRKTESASWPREAVPSKKKRPIWLYVGAGILLIVCCVAVGLTSNLFTPYLPTITINPTSAPTDAPMDFCNGEQTWVSRNYFPVQEIDHCWNLDHYITDLTFSGAEWMMVATKDIAYTDQAYLAQTDFPVATIDEYWNSGFDITDVYFGNGQWLVTMSAGTGFSTQSYLTDASLPNDSIQEYWANGYSITSLAYGNGTWIVIMSQDAGLGVQVYFSEIEFPEGQVRQYWDAGYDITSVAYGNAGWTVVMSQDSGFTDQYYYHRDAFPESGIANDWDEGFSITNLEFGNSLWIVVLSK